MVTLAVARTLSTPSSTRLVAKPFIHSIDRRIKTFFSFSDNFSDNKFGIFWPKQVKIRPKNKSKNIL